MTRHNRYNGLLPAPTCYTDLLRNCDLCCGVGMGGHKFVMDLLQGNWCNGLLLCSACIRSQNRERPQQSQMVSVWEPLGGLV